MRFLDEISVVIISYHVTILSKLDDKSAITISTFPNLHHLNISKAVITDVGISTIMSNCTKLEELNISGCKFGEAGLKTIFSHGTRLKLFHANGVAGLDDTTEGFEHTLILEDVNLDATNVGDKTIRSIATKCKNIKALSIRTVKNVTAQALQGKISCNFVGNLIENQQKVLIFAGC